MTWVIGPLCTDKMDTAWVEVCRVVCIHLYTSDDPDIPKNQLLIDPAECIDCAACEPACPWEAIYQDADVRTGASIGVDSPGLWSSPIHTMRKFHYT